MTKPLCLLITLIASASFVAAADDGFVSLFNGRDLSGWKSNEEKPGCFSVEDGAIKVSNGRAHLFYVGESGTPEFRNFEFKAKVKTLPQANSGIYFHTQYQATGWPGVGFEAQVNSTQRDPKKTGSLYGVVNVIVLADGQEIPAGSLDNIVRERAPSTDGEWFDYFIKVNGSRITIKVNGQTTVDWTQPPGFDPATALTNMPGRKLGAGTFALQGHDPDSVTYFKDIELRVLD